MKFGSNPLMASITKKCPKSCVNYVTWHMVSNTFITWHWTGIRAGTLENSGRTHQGGSGRPHFDTAMTRRYGDMPPARIPNGLETYRSSLQTPVLQQNQLPSSGNYKYNLFWACSVRGRILWLWWEPKSVFNSEIQPKATEFCLLFWIFYLILIQGYLRD